MVCPGPCNPLKAHHHHRHQRRHHHHQRHDITGVATSGKDTLLPDDEFSQMTLESLKADTSVTFVTSTEDTSISRTLSSTRIALIRIPKTPRAKRTDVPAIIRQILPPRKLEMFEEPSRPRAEKTRELPISRKNESPIPPIPSARETAASTPAYQARRHLNDVTGAIMTRLNWLTPKTPKSPLFLCLTILVIYAGIHVLFAVIAWRTPAYQFFASSQICGVLVFLMWRLTGTILI